jgi:PPOX class probable F420-dependent enzyme
VTDKPSDRPAPLEDVDRRRFLHRLSGDAVSTAGRLAGLSAVVRRSVVAASQAAAEEIAPTAHPPADAPTTAVREAGPAPAEADSAQVADPPPGTISEPPAASPAPLTAEQDDLLRRMRSATLAVNDAAGAPHVTSSWFDWDGEVFRLPASLFTAKANNVARDPRVSLLIEDVETGRWVAATGMAETIAGPRVADEALPLRAKYGPGEDSAEAWSDLYPAGDGAVIVIRPTRFVWRTG